MTLINAIGGMGGSGKAKATYITSDYDATNGSSRTFTSVNLGSTGVTKLIVVCIDCQKDNSTSVNATAVTIAGASATKAVGATYNNVTGSAFSSIWYVVGTSTTGNVAITHAASALGCHIHVYNITGYASSTPVATDGTTDESSPISVSCSGNAVIGVLAGRTTSSASWSGLTEDYDNIGETSNLGSSASGVDGGTITVTTGTRVALSAAAWS
jgi:hypothetical protein